MFLEGRIHDGAVVFDQPVALAEGTRVRVEPVIEAKTELEGGQTLLARLGNFVGALDGLPSDLAAQHDHSLYGTSKRP